MIYLFGFLFVVGVLLFLGWKEGRNGTLRETILVDNYYNREINIGLAKRIKKWDEDHHDHYYYEAYELESGKIVVFVEVYFVKLDNCYIEQYENYQDFKDRYFPDPRKVDLDEALMKNKRDFY